MPNIDEIRTMESLDAVVRVPGSKSYTQRALVISALAEGKTFLRNPLFSEDTKYMMAALRFLGAEIVSSGEDVIVTGTAGKITNPGAGIYLGNNGTAMRFLAGMVSLGRGDFLLTGDRRLCERPMGPLLDALRVLGVGSTCPGKEGHPPVVIHAGGIKGGRLMIDGVESSQYVSSILISAPYAKGDVWIGLKGPAVSRPYIDMTVDVMRAFGVPVEGEAVGGFRVKGRRCYESGRFLIEADASSASYFFLAAALCGGRVRVTHMNPQTLQGDIGFLRILEHLGCAVSTGDSWVEVAGKTRLAGECSFDMKDMPDMVPTLAALAAVREGKTVIRNVPHLRMKESNRLEALVNELRRVGVQAEETQDGIVIEGGKPRGAEIETYDDHRIAMSFAMLGLVVRGIHIRNRECVRKSFSGFWEEMKKLYHRP
ncbi:MAG TPA: 3-phosphoshikimate 1-carboxyvinyltransferase [Syntrophales bacterium]|nr:3-phosphoshikimate 1-carboxyvinyltransferase [Syntrophales bacterium]HQM30093.1 3-phosphoshikimate 1-carboxyvinyltransferase [Syntrophales bacterium]